MGWFGREFRDRGMSSHHPGWIQACPGEFQGWSSRSFSGNSRGENPRLLREFHPRGLRKSGNFLRNRFCLGLCGFRWGKIPGFCLSALHPDPGSSPSAFHGFFRTNGFSHFLRSLGSSRSQNSRIFLENSTFKTSFTAPSSVIPGFFRLLGASGIQSQHPHGKPTSGIH